MANDFEVGDAVEYEDAYTGDLKHGRMSGRTAIIKTITEREAGKNPKRIPQDANCLQLFHKTRTANRFAVITA